MHGSMNIKIMKHVLKMQDISFLPIYTKLISRCVFFLHAGDLKVNPTDQSPSEAKSHSVTQ